MSLSAKSLIAFAVYLVGMGLGLLFLPNLLLAPLGFPPAEEVWSRVVGMLALLLAFYYLQAARSGWRPFMQWTVYTRAAVFFFFLAFVVVGLAGPAMILLGSVDLGGAIWTALSLRGEEPAALSVSTPAR